MNPYEPGQAPLLVSEATTERRALGTASLVIAIISIVAAAVGFTIVLSGQAGGNGFMNPSHAMGGGALFLLAFMFASAGLALGLASLLLYGRRSIAAWVGTVVCGFFVAALVVSVTAAIFMAPRFATPT